MKRGWAVMLTLALAGPALGQGPGPGGGRGREEVFRIVDAYILSNLQESLGLTDDAYVRMLPLVKRLQSDRRDGAQRRFESLGELRRLLRSGQATEARVTEMMKEVREREAGDAQRQRTNLEAIDALLTPLQQAKFRILELEVEQRLRRLLEQGRPQGPEGNRPRRPGQENRPERLP